MKRTQAKTMTFRQILARLEAQNAERLIEKARTANRLAKSAPEACARSRAYRVRVTALLSLPRRFPASTSVMTAPPIPSFVVVKYVSPQPGVRCGLHAPAR